MVAGFHTYRVRASLDVYSCAYVHFMYGQKDCALAHKFHDRNTQPQTARWNVDMVYCGSATGLPAWRSTRGERGRKRSRNDLGKVVNHRNSLLEDRSTGLYTHTFNPFQIPLKYVYTECMCGLHVFCSGQLISGPPRKKVDAKELASDVFAAAKR